MSGEFDIEAKGPDKIPVKKHDRPIELDTVKATEKSEPDIDVSLFERLKLIVNKTLELLSSLIVFVKNVQATKSGIIIILSLLLAVIIGLIVLKVI